MGYLNKVTSRTPRAIMKRVAKVHFAFVSFLGSLSKYFQTGLVYEELDPSILSTTYAFIRLWQWTGFSKKITVPECSSHLPNHQNHHNVHFHFRLKPWSWKTLTKCYVTTSIKLACKLQTQKEKTIYQKIKRVMEIMDSSSNYLAPAPY